MKSLCPPARIYRSRFTTPNQTCLTKSVSLGVSHAMAVRVQDGLWRRSSFEGASSNDRRSSNEGGRSNDRPPELDAVDTLFEEALGGTSGCVEGEEKESPDIDAFEYMPQGLRLSYSLRTARTRVESLSTSSHRHGQGL